MLSLKRTKMKKKAKKIKLSAIDKKVLGVVIREQKRIGAEKAKQYQLNYMR